jgi:hypothetical protein
MSRITKKSRITANIVKVASTTENFMSQFYKRY